MNNTTHGEDEDSYFLAVEAVDEPTGECRVVLERQEVANNTADEEDEYSCFLAADVVPGDRRVVLGLRNSPPRVGYEVSVLELPVAFTLPKL